MPPAQELQYQPTRNTPDNNPYPGNFPGSPELTVTEFHVLTLASHGGTAERVAQILLLEIAEIEEARDSIVEKYDVRGMPPAVDKAITERRLKFDRTPCSQIRISDTEWEILQLCRGGYTSAEISNRLQMRKNALRTISGALFGKLRASGRTHSVRKGYEFGLYTLPESPLSLVRN